MTCSLLRQLLIPRVQTQLNAGEMRLYCLFVRVRVVDEMGENTPVQSQSGTVSAGWTPQSILKRAFSSSKSAYTGPLVAASDPLSGRVPKFVRAKNSSSAIVLALVTP